MSPIDLKPIDFNPLDKVREILAAAADAKPQDITTDSSLQSLGLDSLERTQVLYQIEDAFDMEFSEAALRKMVTVGDVVAELTQELSA